MASISNAMAAVDDKNAHNDALHSITNLQQLSSAIDEISSERSPTRVVSRALGETEASYFLPSRESGVNDM